MPPVVPVINIFYFLNSFCKFLISAIELIEKQFESLIVLLTMPVKLSGPISMYPSFSFDILKIDSRHLTLGKFVLLKIVLYFLSQ